MLDEIGAGDIPQILVFNKIDRIASAPRVERDEAGRVSQCGCRPMRGEGLDLLREAFAERLSRVACRAMLRLPVSGGELRARLYAADLVMAERIAADGAFEVHTELSEFQLLKWAREPGVEILALAGDSTCTRRRCLPTIVATKSHSFAERATIVGRHLRRYKLSRRPGRGFPRPVRAPI